MKAASHVAVNCRLQVLRCKNDIVTQLMTQCPAAWRSRMAGCGQATRCVAELAAGMRRLRGFVHVSTAYVNSNCARGSHVEERMYPLRLADGRSADHAAIAAELAALPPRQAERQARSCAAPACT